MGDAEDVEVVASGLALNKVSQWLGVSAESILQEEDEAAAHMFNNPHPQLVGLGAKYLSQKSIEKSGLDSKLKNRLTKSVKAPEHSRHETLSLHHHTSKQRMKEKTKVSSGAAMQQQQLGSSDDEDAGKLLRLADRSGDSNGKQTRVFDRQQLLSVSTTNLSKWQRKRMRQKAKQALSSDK